MSLDKLPKDPDNGKTNLVIVTGEKPACGENCNVKTQVQLIITRLEILEARCEQMEMEMVAIHHWATSAHSHFLRLSSQREKMDRIRRRRKEVIKKQIVNLRKIQAFRERNSKKN